MSGRFINIIGTGKYLPERIVLAQELFAMIGKESVEIKNKLGITKRHFVCAAETTSFMAVQAAKQALENGKIIPEELDCIIGACGVMEQPIPCTATLVQKQLGLELSGIAAFDINSTCLSFLSALDVASYMIDAGRFRNVLIVSSDIPSLGLNWGSIENCTTFGDGAAAAVISKPIDNMNIQVLASHMETYSEGSSYCRVQAGGTKMHPSKFKGDLAKYALFEMDGKAAYKLTVRVIDGFIERLFKDTGLDLSDINLVIPHQASQMAMNHLRKKLHIPEEKFIDIFSTHGNQVAASIPTALHEAFMTKRIQRGDKFLLIGTGAGISLGGMILQFNQ
jgi:3-oxoacyl-[acyl-carrier-protein] synthase-3